MRAGEVSESADMFEKKQKAEEKLKARYFDFKSPKHFVTPRSTALGSRNIFSTMQNTGTTRAGSSIANKTITVSKRGSSATVAKFRKNVKSTIRAQ